MELLCKLFISPALVILLSKMFIVTVYGAVQNACYLNNGQCRYQVQVVSDCDPNVQNSPRQHGGHRTGPNAIEKYLLEVKSEHSKRIAELEGKMVQHLVQKKPEPKPTERPRQVKPLSREPESKSNKVLSRIKKRTRSHNNTGFKKDPLRKENHLLNRVHKEFSSLRNELAGMKEKLFDTENSLRARSKKLNETEAQNRKLSHQLRHTEGKLEEEQANGYTMKKTLDKTVLELNETKLKLVESQADLRRMRLQNWKLKGESDDCKKSLAACLADKEVLKRALEQALIKYHELNVRHENITIQMNITQRELVTCYKGKTTQFCGFEDSEICGFEQGESSTDLEWIRWHKATPSAYTGPSHDHTCRNDRGYYLYVEATSRGEGETTSLVSPRYYGYGEQCVEFYYHMHGYHVGTLKVQTIVPYQEAVPTWRAFGNQGDVWTMARIPVPAEEASTGYQVVFQATIGFGNDGDIAIDDVRVFDGSCYGTSATDDVINGTANQQDSDVKPNQPERDKT